MQLAGAFVLRVQGEDAAHPAPGPHHVAPAQVGLALAQHVLDVALLLDQVQAIEGTLVMRLDAQDSLVTQARAGEVALAAGEVRVAQQGRYRPLALGGQGHLRAGVARGFAGCLLQPGQAFLELAGIDQVQALALGQVGRATGQQKQSQVPRQALHRALPTARDWAMSSGR
ncbi:hypothetical protein D3C84_320210 [compost metagenome]